MSIHPLRYYVRSIQRHKIAALLYYIIIFVWITVCIYYCCIIHLYIYGPIKKKKNDWSVKMRLRPMRVFRDGSVLVGVRWGEGCTGR